MSEYTRWPSEWPERARALYALGGRTFKDVARQITYESVRFCPTQTCRQWIIPEGAPTPVYTPWDQKWRDRVIELHGEDVRVANIAAIIEIEAERPCSEQWVRYWLKKAKRAHTPDQTA